MTGVVIGRFQIDDLHEGHRALIDEVQKRHNDVLILIGDPGRRDVLNPLNPETRRTMIKSVREPLRTR